MKERDTEIFSLDQNFSTTRLITKRKPEVVNRSNNEFKSLLFFPKNKDRKAEGGLRTKEYFKQNLSGLPLVTIITVVFNGEKYLKDTIHSVVNQSYDNIEYIIIDGNSTDRTLDIIKKHEDKIDYWISERDNGIYHAMNKGISLASGNIIGIINSDDWLELDTVEDVAEASLTIQDKEFVIHGKIAFYNADNMYRGQHSPKNIPGYYLFSTPFKHPAMFVSRRVYQRIGLYNDCYGLAADYDLMLRIISHDYVSVFIDKVLTNVRLVGISTGGHARASNRELMLILKHTTGSWLLATIGLVVRTISKWIQSINFNSKG